MHEPIPLQGKWLRQVVRGYFAYHAVPTNGKYQYIPTPCYGHLAEGVSPPKSKGPIYMEADYGWQKYFL
jgi:hypothetical protein